MQNTFMESLKHHIGSVIFAGLVLAALSIGLLVVFGSGSVARSDFLLVQTNAGNQDFYTSFKSSEYLSKVLGEAVVSERFIQAAIETGKMTADMLPAEKDKSARLKAWRDMVSVKQDASLGMISIEAKSRNDRDAYRMLQAASEVLVNRNALFRGGDEKSVEVRLLSGPIVEKTPGMKEMIIALALGFLVGASLGTLRAFVRDRRSEKELREIFATHDMKTDGIA
jgi:hypothetical protein